MLDRSRNRQVRGLGRLAAGSSATALALCLAFGLIAPSTALAQDQGVVSYRGKSATANDIIKSFTGGSAKTKKPAGRSRFRSIRFNDAPTPPPQDPPQQQEESQQQQETAQPQQDQGSTQASADGGCPQSGTVVALEIKFSVNSAVLEAEAYRNLRQMAEAMKSAELSGCKFAVEGHTDASGRSSSNLRLSKLRASSVKNFLMSSDINTRRLKTVGKGDREPLKGNDPRSPENRRVQFRIIGAGG